MERRQMVVLLAEDEEYGVKEVNKLGQIEPPGQRQGIDSFWISGVINGLTDPVIFASKPVGCSSWNIKK